MVVFRLLHPASTLLSWTLSVDWSSLEDLERYGSLRGLAAVASSMDGFHKGDGSALLDHGNQV